MTNDKSQMTNGAGWDGTQTTSSYAEAGEDARHAFFSALSHAIRTPLNGIVGFSELLELGGETENERLQYAAAIHSCGLEILQMFNDILEQVRLESENLDEAEFNRIFRPFIKLADKRKPD